MEDRPPAKNVGEPAKRNVLTLVCQVIYELGVLAIFARERFFELKDGRVDRFCAVTGEDMLDLGKYHLHTSIEAGFSC